MTEKRTPEKRTPAKARGGFGTASTFGSLDGWTLTEADEYLSTHSELKPRSISAGGYQRYEFKDSSELIIRPSGQIIRLPYLLYSADGSRIKGMRHNIVTGQIIRSEAWHRLPRDEQEWVVLDDNSN